MPLSYDLVLSLQNSSPSVAWSAILDYAWEVCSEPITPGKAEAQVAQRDRIVGDIDHYIATAAWDLWLEYEASVTRTCDALVNWWASQQGGKAILILDALSLREVPWLLAGADSRGYKVHSAGPTCAELPADTTPFAKALGFSQRSSLGNNGAGGAHLLPGARTESVGVPWKDCANLVGSEPDWVFWHHWPDHRLHDNDDPGKGLSHLTMEIERHLTSDEFWSFVERLASGRRLIITSDHGYAASGLFTDSDQPQTDYLKKNFKSGRWEASPQPAGQWVPPIDLSIETEHGKNLYVCGRRKWKSAGGYPTLTHGGLSVLEVAVPFIELTRK